VGGVREGLLALLGEGEPPLGKAAPLTPAREVVPRLAWASGPAAVRDRDPDAVLDRARSSWVTSIGQIQERSFLERADFHAAGHDRGADTAAARSRPQSWPAVNLWPRWLGSPCSQAAATTAS